MCTTTVQHCCCGCSLKTGTIILLILTTLGAVFWFFGAFSGTGNVRYFTVFASLVVLAICAAGFYGIQGEKPEYVLPYAILQFLGMIICTFVAIISIVARQGVIDWLKDNAEKAGTPYSPEQLQALSSAFILLTVIMVSSAALQYYIYVVVYSLYKKLQENRRPPVVQSVHA